MAFVCICSRLVYGQLTSTAAAHGKGQRPADSIPFSCLRTNCRVDRQALVVAPSQCASDVPVVGQQKENIISSAVHVSSTLGWLRRGLLVVISTGRSS